MWSIQHVSLFEAGAYLLAPEIQRFFKQLRPEPGKHWRISIILLATAAALESLSFMLISTIDATPRSMSPRPQIVCEPSRSRATYHPILFPCLARMTWFHVEVEIHKGTPALAAAPRQCWYHWPSLTLITLSSCPHRCQTVPDCISI